MKILLLEDDPSCGELIQIVLREQGHDVHWFTTGNRLIQHLENSTTDFLILDWSVPGISGLDVLWWVRKRFGSGLPVIFITNHAREDEVVMALNAGADDYMIKPVRPRELLARMTALMRRSLPQTESTETRIEIGRYLIDVLTQQIFLDDELIDVAPREFDVALLLFRNIGRIIPRDNMIKQIWGKDLNKMSRSLDTHIYRLRQKLRIGPANGLRLRAIYTHGYRLEPAGSDESEENQ